ncbi:transcription termination factor 1 isoform X2 [Engystomops pustulosus]|uniref:transcription termination factor 1 isoform X2 n=1 Tax=Engystomops pustulosus TaxID=76066 RepID=UPI003AFAD2DA
MSQWRCPDGSLNPERVEEGVEQTEKQKKRKRKDDPQQESEHITMEANMGGGTIRVGELTNDEDGTDDRHTQQCSSAGLVNYESLSETTEPTSSSRPLDSHQNPATQGGGETLQYEEHMKRIAELRHLKRYRFSYISRQDFELLKEYFPKASDKTLVTLIQTKEVERVRVAKKLGIMYRRSKFTLAEDKQIKSNLAKFMKLVGIDSPDLIFNPHKYPEKKKTIMQLKTAYKFLQTLAEGIYRPVNEVLYRGARLYCGVGRRGRFSKKEEEKLIEYCKLYNNSWKEIGLAMDRSLFSCQLKKSQMLEDAKKGMWSEEEMNCLLTAVKEFVLDSLRKENNNEEPVTVPKLRLYVGISWVSIQAKVRTRSWTHCKLKWFSLIYKRMNRYKLPSVLPLRYWFDIKLINWFYDNKLEEFGDVDWTALSLHLGNVPNIISQRCFLELKRKVPNYKELRLCGLLKFSNHPANRPANLSESKVC